jgi:hypothetical protein
VNEIRRVLKLAAWRLLVIDIFHTLAITLTAAMAALIVALLAERIFGLVISFPGDWEKLAAIAVGAGVLASITWSLIRRARGITVARELDERADLRESLSTAMCVEKSQDAWAKVVVENARERAMKVDVRRAIPYAAPRLWPVPFALVLSMVVLWFSVPRWDVLGMFKKAQAKQDEQNQITEVKAEIKQNDQKLEEMLKQAKIDLKADEATQEASDAKTPQTPEEIRRAAVKKLTSQVDKLAEMRQGDKAKQMDAIKQAMKQLKQPGPGPLEQLSKAMQKGDFAKAKEELDEANKQMASANMSPEDKAKAQEQMKKLAEQLDKLSKDKQELQKQLQQAGMDKDAAAKASKSPDELKKALDEMKNMSEAEKKELMKNALAQMAACKQCEGLGEKMSQMAQNSGKAGMNEKAQEAMEAMEGQLSEMEQMGKDCEAAEAALDEAKGQLAKMAGKCQGNCPGGNCDGEGELAMSEKQSPWRAGESQGKFGNGQGGPGQSGGGAHHDNTDAPVGKVDKMKANNKDGGGPIIGSRLVYGDQVRGESQAEYTEAVEASSKAATEAIENMQVQKELQGTVKHYFGRLEAKAKAQQAAPAEKKDEPKKEEPKKDGK